MGGAHRASRLCHPCVPVLSPVPSLLPLSCRAPLPSVSRFASSSFYGRCTGGAAPALRLRPHASHGLSGGWLVLEGTTGRKDDRSKGKRADGGASKNSRRTETLSVEEVERIDDVLRVTAAAAADQYGARSRINSRSELA